MRREIRDNMVTLVPELDAESTFSSFERRLIDALLNSIGVDSQRENVGRQLATARVVERAFSGVGFFIGLRADSPEKESHPPIRSGLGSAWIYGPSIKTGAEAFILADEGRITCIEGITFDESWPADDAIRYLLDEEPEAQIQVGNTWR